jgi:predicted Zn-dependent protease
MADPDLGAAASRLIQLVKKRAPEAEASVAMRVGRAQNTRFAAGEITTAGDTDISDVVLTVALGTRHATTTTTETDPSRLEPLVERALAMAKLAPEDPEWVPVLGPQKYATTDEWDEATATLGHEHRAKAAREIIAQADAKQVIPAGFYATSAVTHLFATSRGLSARHRSTRAGLTLTVRTPDGTGSGWAGSSETRAGAIDANALARTAIDKCVASRAPKALAPGDYTVVLEPTAVGDLLTYLMGSLDARSTDEGRSFFSKPNGGSKVGDKLIWDKLSLVSDPSDARTPGAPFDDEGVPLSKLTWFEQGTLKSLGYSRFWAAKKNVPPTGNQNGVLLSGGEAESTEALVKKVKRGLLVTRLWYIRWLQPRELTVTGLTRDGVFLIENGKISHPVNNFRFNQSPLETLARAVDATKDTVRVPAWGDLLRVPAILSERFHMASVSAAV